MITPRYLTEDDMSETQDLFESRALIVRYRDKPGDTCPICHEGRLELITRKTDRDLPPLVVVICDYNDGHTRAAIQDDFEVPIPYFTLEPCRWR